MRTLALLPGLAIALALALAAPARADEGMDEDGARAEPARALTLQALALLEQGAAHEAAEEKLDLALEADDKGGIDLRALRAAHEALHREEAAEAERLLAEAFPAGEHVVGVTYKPGSASALVVSAIAGALLLAAAALGLLRRREADRRYERATPAGR